MDKTAEKPDTLLMNCEAYACLAREDTEGAEAIYRKVLEIEPENPAALKYLGEIVGQTGRSIEAVPILQKALNASRDDPSIWLDLGQAMQMKAQTVDEMVEGLAHTMTGTRMAERMGNQHFPGGHFNAALALIKMNEWRQGYKEYEYGYLCGKRHLRTLKGHLWKGEEIGPEKTLFVYWEGGYGDTIFWTRLLPLVKEKSGGAKIILEVQRALGCLYRGCSGAHSVCEAITTPNIDDLEDVPEFDYRISLQSLAHILNIGSAEDMPGEPYISSNLAPWPIRSSKIKVGVVWKGNPALDNDANRSMDESEMWECFERVLEDVNLYSLQYEAEPTYFNKLPIKDFLDTVAMIKSMDLIVTVDTSVAHLAGAMGKKVWMLLPYIAADYRWGLESETTPLYPSMRMFRQKYPGDWGEVARRVSKEIEELSGILGRNDEKEVLV